MTDRRTTYGAFAASILVHLLAILFTWNAELVGEPAMVPDRAPVEELELTLLPDPEAEEPEQPTTYVDIPERLAAENPPERADFLALHDSRAADLVEGGAEDAAPAADLLSKYENVAIRREELGGAGVVFSPPAPSRGGAAPERPGEGEEEESRERGAEASALGAEALAESGEEARARPVETAGEGREDAAELPELVGGPAPSILKNEAAGEGDRGFEFDQLATGDISGNIVRTGAFSLNTYEWNWAPWMKRFGQDIQRHWIPPYAYYALGLLSGETSLLIVIARSGTVQQLDIKNTVGHESLHQSSVAAIKAAAPFAPLPPDFPEENLVIYYTLEYPAWERLMRQVRSNGSEPSRRRRR